MGPTHQDSHQVCLLPAGGHSKEQTLPTDWLSWSFLIYQESSVAVEDSAATVPWDCYINTMAQDWEPWNLPVMVKQVPTTAVASEPLCCMGIYFSPVYAKLVNVWYAEWGSTAQLPRGSQHAVWVTVPLPHLALPEVFENSHTPKWKGQKHSH
jgi:hypothetical protein